MTTSQATNDNKKPEDTGDEEATYIKETVDTQTVNKETDSAQVTVVETDNGVKVGKESEQISLKYEPWQYNPISNRTGKKKYDSQFLKDVGEKICKLSIFDEDKYEDSTCIYPYNTKKDLFEPNYSMQLPHLANFRLNDPSRRQNQQSYNQDRPRKIIVPSPSLAPEVELKTVDNPWRPGKESKEELDAEAVELESLKKSFRSILNKLTPDNFDKLSKSVTDLGIDTESKLGEVIDIVFAKALSEPGYCVLYGQMCSHLRQTGIGQRSFASILLKRCQSQFQADIYSGIDVDGRNQQVEAETDPDVKKQLSEQLYEDMYRCRVRGLGLIKFIGVLYKIEMLNDDIMFDCISRLLQDSSEESLECLCDLLVTIGEKLDKSAVKSGKEAKRIPENSSKSSNAPKKSMASVLKANSTPKAMKTLDDIFDNLHKIRNNKELPISIRIRFKLLDVCELREKFNWQSKKTKDGNPKKIEEIKKDHEEKLVIENRKAQAFNNRRAQENRRGLGHSSGSSSQISSLANESNVNRGGVSNMHGSASSHAICDHTFDDRKKQNHSDSCETSKVQHQKYINSAMNFLSNRKNDTSQKPSDGLRPTSNFMVNRLKGSGSNNSSQH